MAKENGPVEDVFPNENGDFPATGVKYPPGSTITWRAIAGKPPDFQEESYIDSFMVDISS